MRKDTTKKFLSKNKEIKDMTPPMCFWLFMQNKGNILGYDIIEFKNSLVLESKMSKDNDSNKITNRKTESIPNRHGKFYPSTQFNMIYCPKGSYVSSKDKLKRAKKVDHFFLSDTPITFQLYTQIIGSMPANYKINEINNPITNISFVDAIKFCNALSEKQGLEKCYTLKIDQLNDHWSEENEILRELHWDFQKNGYRLPTYDEWVYAAKANTNNKWFGTNDIDQVDDYLWYELNSNNQKHNVATKKPNTWGFYDMGGNVYEWCTMDKNVLDTKSGFGLVGFACGTNKILLKYLSEIESFYYDSDKLNSEYQKSTIGFRIARTIPY